MDIWVASPNIVNNAATHSAMYRWAYKYLLDKLLLTILCFEKLFLVILWEYSQLSAREFAPERRLHGIGAQTWVSCMSTLCSAYLVLSALLSILMDTRPEVEFLDDKMVFF